MTRCGHWQDKTPAKAEAGYGVSPVRPGGLGGGGNGITPEIEPILPRRPPPWTTGGPVRVILDVGDSLNTRAADSVKRDAALHHLASPPQCATWIWTDGSATRGVRDGGAGALIVTPNEDRHELRLPEGAIRSSF